MTLAPTLTNSKEGSLNETEPVAAAAPRSGVLGWFGTSSSISSGTGNTGAVGEREEPKTQVEEAAAERSEPESTITEKEEGLLERERQVESREKELEDRKLVVDQREREVEDRSRGLEDRERVVKEGELEVQRKIEEVERREKELEERRGQFEKEREKWEEEKNRPRETEWRTAMDALKRAVDLELFAERKQAEERELELETRVMKKVTEILALDKDEQNTKLSGWKKRWDVSIKPLTRWVSFYCQCTVVVDGHS